MARANMTGWIVLGLLAIVSLSVQAQSTMRVRGMITDFDGSVLSVKSRDGKDLKLKLADNATIVAAKAITVNDLKPGDYVGSTTRTAHRGQPTGCEVITKGGDCSVSLGVTDANLGLLGWSRIHRAVGRWPHPQHIPRGEAHPARIVSSHEPLCGGVSSSARIA